jgi:ABC-2 type transport system permease protein
MKPLLRAELIKLSTTRTFVGLSAVAVGISLLITVLVAVLTEPTEENVLYDVFASDTSSLFILVLAIVGIGGEWRHHTITSSLLAAPDRVRFLAAKTLAFAAAGALLSLLISVAVAIVGFVILSLRDLPLPEAGELIDLLARNALMATLLGAFGVGIGALLRNPIIAIVGVLVFSFAVEPALLALAPSVGRFGPFVALSTAAVDVPPENAGLGDVDLLAPGLAVLALFAWISAAFAAGAALLRWRDVD